MFGAGFQEGNSAEIPIEGTTSAGFKVLLNYLYYTDNLEMDDAVLFDLGEVMRPVPGRAPAQPLYVPIVRRHHRPECSLAAGASKHR
jgi:hypothetical protein